MASSQANIPTQATIQRLLALILASLTVSFVSVLSADRPNILLIFADDVGSETLGCYGGRSYPTPNIDRLAMQGMRFDHCYVMPVCHPSRICLLTGQYPARLNNPQWGDFPKEAEGRTVAQILKRAGYATAVAGKWQLALLKDDPHHVGRLGFDESCVFGWHEGPRYHEPMLYQNGGVRDDTEGRYGPDIYTEFLIDFMKRNQAAQQPFFAFYSMALCHDVTDDLDEPVPFYKDERWMNYAEMMQSMDEMVGRLIQALDTTGLSKNTLVLFTTDNGTAAKSYLDVRDGKMQAPPVYSETVRGERIRGGKGTFTDRGTRVPLIARWPGSVPANQRRSDLVDLSDFLPTFASLANQDLPSEIHFDGYDISACLRNEKNSPRKWAYSENKQQRFVRTARWKLYQDGRFFDAQADPDNLAPLTQIPESAKPAKTMLDKALNNLPWTP